MYIFGCEVEVPLTAITDLSDEYHVLESISPPSMLSLLEPMNALDALPLPLGAFVA